MQAVEHLERRLRARGGRTGRFADVMEGARRRAREDRVSIVAAGLAFYVLLSAVPALVATVAVYAAVRDVASLVQRLESWTRSFPDEIQRLLVGQLIEVAGTTGVGAGVGFTVSVLATFWASSRAARALMQSLNIVQGNHDGRSTTRRHGIAVAVAIAGVVTAVVVLGLVETGAARSGPWWETATTLLFWPALLLGVGVAAVAAYRYAPSSARAAFTEVLPGALLTVVVFAVATGVVAVYVVTLGIGRAYGALGFFVAVGLWLLTVCWALLVGAYLNQELAPRQARPDHTGHGSRGG